MKVDWEKDVQRSNGKRDVARWRLLGGHERRGAELMPGM